MEVDPTGTCGAGGEDMPLSEHEQRLLDQIERALYAEDPKFVSTVRGGRLRKPTKRRRLQGVALFLLGLVLLVVGLAVRQIYIADFPVVSILGFRSEEHTSELQSRQYL